MEAPNSNKNNEIQEITETTKNFRIETTKIQLDQNKYIVDIINRNKKNTSISEIIQKSRDWNPTQKLYSEEVKLTTINKRTIKVIK